jgi:hypothetical protein
MEITAGVYIFNARDFQEEAAHFRDMMVSIHDWKIEI